MKREKLVQARTDNNWPQQNVFSLLGIAEISVISIENTKYQINCKVFVFTWNED